LFRVVEDLIQVVWAIKQFLCFLESDPALLPQPLAFDFIELEAQFN